MHACVLFVPWLQDFSVISEIQKKGDWKRPPTPYVKGLTSGEALRVIIALANNYMEDCAIPGF